MRKFYLFLSIVIILVASATIYLSHDTEASSHREAPIISTDPLADNTDVYAFIPADDPSTACIIACFNPMEEPAGGPNFNKFGTDVLYELKIDNTGDRIPDVVYQFEFTDVIGNGNTFLYNTGSVTSLADPDLNVKQTYVVKRIVNGVTQFTSGALPVAPAYVGGNSHSDPNYVGPSSMPDYASLMSAATQDLPSSGGKVFAGPTDDPFFVDLGAAFDLLKIRPGAPGNAGGGKDALTGYNVHTIAIKVPKSSLLAVADPNPSPTNPNSIIGVWSTTSRRTTTVINADGTRLGTGPFVQVSRLGMPLVNEVVLPLSQKDKWNASLPLNDAQFLNYVTSPELAGIINTLYPVTDDIPTSGRTDLVQVFLTGVPGLNRRPQDTITPSEQLRLNVGIAPVAFESENKLGVIAGDVAGFPNGRRLRDDVVDIALRVVAGVLLGPPYSTGVNSLLGDGVNRNDRTFMNSFPYVAMPHEGYANSHGMIVAVLQNGEYIGTPKEFDLQQNYPNPFNPSTTIKFSLLKQDNVRLTIYNILGEEVKTLVNEKMSSGLQTITWNGIDNSGKPVASGTYFVKIVTSSGVDSKKMVLVK
jgi:hypothetical protein